MVRPGPGTLDARAFAEPETPCVDALVVAGHPRQLLVLRRVPARGGFWQSVSGKVDPQDRDAAAAAVREVGEETGFHDVVRVEDLGWSLAFQHPDGRPLRGAAFGVEVSAVRPPTLSAEHDGHAWLPVGQALDRLHWPDNREAFRRLLMRWGP